MTKQITSVAKAVKAAAGGGAAFVFTSRACDLPQDEEQLNRVFASAKYSTFGCTACGTNMQARADTSPFCISCSAGDEVKELKANTKPSISASSELTSLECSKCKSATVLESAVVASITSASKGGPIHCSCCAAPMFHVGAGVEDGATGDTELVMESDGMDVEDEDVELDDLEAAFSARSAKKVKAADPEDDLEDEGDDELDVKSGGGLENFEGKQAAPFKKEADALTDDLVLEPFTLEEDLGDDDVLDDPIGVTEELDPSLDDEFDLADTQGDPLADALELDDTDAALAFVRASGRVVAMKGHTAVASFSKKTAGKNAFLINSDALPAAASAAVQADGLRKGLESVGFKLIRVPASSAMATAKAAQKVQAAADKKEADRKREFAGIFALAAAGLNRGNWRGHANPLRTALESRLAALGAESPKRIAASILEEAGLQYSQTLLEISSKLSAMSASARKEMGEMLELTSVVATAEEDDEDEGVEASALEARLTKPALLRPSITSSASSVTGAAAVLSGRAKLTFASV